MIPFNRINSAIASQSSSDIFAPPSAADSPMMAAFVQSASGAVRLLCDDLCLTSITKIVNILFERSVRNLASDASERSFRNIVLKKTKLEKGEPKAQERPNEI